MRSSSIANRSNASTSRSHGFTLFEVMIAALLFLIIISGVLTTFLSVNRSILSLADSVGVNGKSRLLHERFLFDVRAISETSTIIQSTGLDPETNTTGTVCQDFTCKLWDYAAGTVQQIRFYYDPATKQVMRENKTTNLKTIVMSDVEMIRFRFYDRTSSGASATWTPSAVSRIRSNGVPTKQKAVRQGENLRVATA